MVKRKKSMLVALFAATVMSVVGAVAVSASGITYDITTSGMTVRNLLLCIHRLILSRLHLLLW